MDRLYSFVMRGELAKVSLSYTEALSKHHSSDIIVQDYIESLSLDLLDDEYISSSKLMATVYTAISAFENTIREFVVKILIENKGENWWEDCVSEKIRNKAETRKEQEDKVRWHTQRGDSLINYTEFGDLASIMNNNLELFSDHIVSIEWARNIIATVERSRNVIMHSGELSARDIERIGINIRDWISQVGA
ncbi:Swt1 family HEPN domain-containing protein [Filifactor alocis]